MPVFSKTLAVALATAGLLATAGAVSAMEAAAKSSVNVRTGPGTGFAIADKLDAGEVVDVTECAPSGWCYIEHSGPDGWVSSSFLVPTSDDEEEEDNPPSGSNPDCGFGLTVGPGGPSLSINCGDTPPPAPPSPPPAADDDEDEVDGPQACFYVNTGFSGSSFCMAEGTKNSLNNTFRDKISSVEISGGLKAKLCVDNNLGGYCKTVTSDTDDLPNQIDNKASSIQVFSGAEPVGPIAPVGPLVINPNVIQLLTPTTFSTGPINWKPSFTIDLDAGTQGAGGADLWYDVGPGNGPKFITPTNGGKISIVDFAQHGYSGCKNAAFTTAKLSFDNIAVGNYICAKTNQGRISEFRVNGFTGDIMKIGYTTWSN